MLKSGLFSIRYRSQALSGLAGLEHHGKVSNDKDDHWAVGPVKHADPRNAKVKTPSENHRRRSLSRQLCLELFAIPIPGDAVLSKMRSGTAQISRLF
jgi:hypothetical protein